MKFLGGMSLGTRNKLLDLGGDLNMDQEPGIFHFSLPFSCRNVGFHYGNLSEFNYCLVDAILVDQTVFQNF